MQECLLIHVGASALPSRYDITHAGLDAMVTRYINDMVVFANLPNELAFANHSR